MNKLPHIITLIGVGVFIVFSILFLGGQQKQLALLKEQVKIQKEAHILGVYAEYRNNIDSCKAIAEEQGKDDVFIQANCVEAVNGSMLGDILQDWNKLDLLISE